MNAHRHCGIRARVPVDERRVASVAIK